MSKLDEKALEAAAREICRADSWNFGGPDAIVDSEWDDNGVVVAQAPAWKTYRRSAEAAIKAYLSALEAHDQSHAVKDIIERLRGFPVTYPVAHEAASALQSLVDRNAAMEEALRPFAKEAAIWDAPKYTAPADTKDPLWADDFHPVCDTSRLCTQCGDALEDPEKATFTVGDLRRARSALPPEDQS